MTRESLPWPWIYCHGIYEHRVCIALSGKGAGRGSPGIFNNFSIFPCRSFEPILRLLPQGISPVSQHWATWALYNLVSVYRKFPFRNHVHRAVKAEGVGWSISAEVVFPV